MKHFLLLSLFFLFGSLNVSAQSTPTPESEITSLASAVAEIERLQSEIQRLRGELERQNFLLSKIEQDSKTIQQDVMMSTRSLEEKFQLYRDALQRALANVSPALAKETAKFEKGLDQANAAEYAGAIQTFEQFLKEYPKSPQREMAHFWIAECRFSTREFSQAI
ncbi:MAG: tetratricopeptide repeat protein, partial [Deltaproteobacteria bacterium]|nr:tetratricopeptide repeat protein [Deltaproteobacteria bacterium]